MSKILLDAGMSPRGWSKRSTWLRCPHKHALHEAGYIGDDRDPLLRGSTFHVGMAHHYAQAQAVQLGADPNDYWSANDAMLQFVRKFPECEPFLDLCVDAIEAYVIEYAMEQWRILAVEELIVMDIVGPTTGKTYKHTARVDLIVADRNNQVWVWDHKTSGQRVDKKKRLGFELSGQVIGLSWWARKTWGLDFAGFVINFVGLDVNPPRDKAKRSGDDRFQFLRFHPRLAPYAQSMFPMTVEHSEEYLLWMEARYGTHDPDLWPPMLQEQGPCMDRYGPCEFRSMCRWGTGVGGQDT